MPNPYGMPQPPQCGVGGGGGMFPGQQMKMDHMQQQGVAGTHRAAAAAADAAVAAAEAAAEAASYANGPLGGDQMNVWPSPAELAREAFTGRRPSSGGSMPYTPGTDDTDDEAWPDLPAVGRPIGETKQVI